MRRLHAKPSSQILLFLIFQFLLFDIEHVQKRVHIFKITLQLPNLVDIIDALDIERYYVQFHLQTFERGHQ